MKARCIKELTIDGYRFEPGKEYDIEWRAFTRDADERDPVLARGYKVRHIQYAVKYDMIVPLPFSKQGTEKTPATLFLYDRQYCEHEDYTAPAIEPFGWTAGGPLLCFDDFFEEVSEGMDNKSLFTPDILGMATHQPDWPRRTEVVAYARKEDREKVLMKMSQMGYAVTKFVEVSGLQAELMGDGCFIVMAELLRPKPVRWEPSPYSVVKAWQDRMQNNVIDPVIYPSSELLDQMKDFFPMRCLRMLGGTRPSDWPRLKKEQENE